MASDDRATLSIPSEGIGVGHRPVGFASWGVGVRGRDDFSATRQQGNGKGCVSGIILKYVCARWVISALLLLAHSHLHLISPFGVRARELHWYNPSSGVAVEIRIASPSEVSTILIP